MKERMRHAIRRLLFRRAAPPPLPPPAKPNPKDYSTIVGKGSVVPCQIEAYFLALNAYVSEGAEALDVGFGLGYGLNILAIKARRVCGVDVDPKVLAYCNDTVRGRNPRLDRLELYDGRKLPFRDAEFDVLTCVDVLEHVEDYDAFLDEMLRVSRKGVFISTPNRRPEYTHPDGTPKNHWHLREWSFEELDAILARHGPVEWHFLDGPFEGPFRIGDVAAPETLTLTPFLFKRAPETPQR
jgi:2-polyprenyl-3-methyl-5-hydroxy-6-metoxy-1,4-benzoquinol methylase